MASTSRRSSRQALTTHVTDSSNSNIIFLNLLKISPDTRFALTRSSGTLGVNGVAPGRLGRGSSTVTGVGVDIDDVDVVVRNAVVTDIDAKQRRSILTDVVIILDFQVLSLGVRAVEGGDSSAAAMATRSSDGRPCPPAPFLNGARWWRLAMSTPEDEDSASDTDLQCNRKKS